MLASTKDEIGYFRDRIHLLYKPHPSCCNTKTSPYPAKTGQESLAVLSLFALVGPARDRIPDDRASLRPRCHLSPYP